MWTISLPLAVRVSKKKLFHLNLNQYRNTNPFTLNTAKVNFTEQMKDLLVGIPKLQKLVLKYTLYPGNAQLCDTNNVCCIVDKFFSDALKEHGVIEDDNYNFIADTQFCFGCIDRENPRVDVVIRSPDHIPLVPPELLESENMKISTVITLTQMDLNQALAQYLEDQISVPATADLVLEKQADGTYLIRIDQDASHPVSSTTTEQPQPKRRGRPPKMEPKAAMEALQEIKGVRPAQMIVDEMAPGPDDTVNCEACGELLNGENSSTSPSDGRVIHIGCKAEEKPPAAAPRALFVQPKDVNPDNLTAEAHVEAAQEAKPLFGKKPEESQESKPAEPEAPKGPSLFANFKRPNNG